jgi:hypothetical protein
MGQAHIGAHDDSTTVELRSLVRKPQGIVNRRVFISLLLVASRLLANQPASSGSVAPLWTVEVLQQEPNSSGNRTPDALMQIPKDSPGVAFLDNNRLIVYETGSTGKLSSRTNPDLSSAFRLHATVIDPASGKFMLTKDWGARPYGSSIQVTSGGILVRTGEVLRIVSHDFSEVHRWTYPEIPNRSDPRHCDTRTISVSPTGETVMVSCHNFKLNSTHLDVWDSNLSKSKYSWNETTQPDVFLHSYSISDTGIAAMDPRQQNIIVTQFGSTVWETLDVGTNQPESEVFCANFPTLVTDTRLVNVCSSGFLLVSTDGHVLMTDPLDKMGSPTRPPNRNFAISQNGQLIAVSLDRMDVKKHLRSEDSVRRVSTQLVLYDLHLRQRVLNVNITPLPERDYDFALSPDGSRLAVLNARNVSVYSVPVQ